MWSIIVFVSAALIVACEAPPLWKQNKRKELWTFSVLLGAAVAAGLAQSMRIKLWNPLDLITIIYKPIGDGIASILS